MAITIYGIKTCDTMKKARAWLESHGIAAGFHDYKASGIDEASLRRWVGEHGWETVLNRAGTTFRALPDADKQGLDAGRANRADAGPALDDQAPGARPRRWQDHRGLQARGLRRGAGEGLKPFWRHSRPRSGPGQSLAGQGAVASFGARCSGRAGHDGATVSALP